MEAKRYIKRCQNRVNTALSKFLPLATKEPKELHAAMRYAVLNGGKRLRSALTYAVGEAFGANQAVLDRVAAAIELAHAFSLVHDDLPALDDDDLRRGKPACHKAFGEAVAILTGDALQTLAFQLLSDIDVKNLKPHLTLKIINLFARAVGHAGLAGGQTLDIAMLNKIVSLKNLAKTYQLKTGQFITTSILMGALAGQCENETQLNSLKKFGDALGLAFQIHDDIIGIETETRKLGKTQGSDLARNKPTYPSLIGIPAAKKAEKLALKRAMEFLKKTGIEITHIAGIATYMIDREF